MDHLGQQLHDSPSGKWWIFSEALIKETSKETQSWIGKEGKWRNDLDWSNLPPLVESELMLLLHAAPRSLSSHPEGDINIIQFMLPKLEQLSLAAALKMRTILRCWLLMLCSVL